MRGEQMDAVSASRSKGALRELRSTTFTLFRPKIVWIGSGDDRQRRASASWIASLTACH